MLDAATRQLDVIDTQKQQTQAALDQAHGGPRSRRSSISAGRKSARRSTAWSATAARVSAPMPPSGPRFSPSFRPMAFGSMPISRKDSLPRIREGHPAEVVADVLPGVIFHGRVISFAPATGAQFSVIPPENATGNFTKVIQRVPVRIELEGNGAELGRLRPGLSVVVHVDGRPRTGDRQARP